MNENTGEGLKINFPLRKIYLSLVLKKIELPEFLRVLDEEYVKIMTEAVNSIPNIKLQ